MPELFTDILDPDPAKPIPPEILAYFCRRVRLDFHREVVGKWHQLETMTQKDLADRLGKRKEVISRLLGAPGNWELDTVTMLLVAMRALPRLRIDNFEDLLNADGLVKETVSSVFDQMSRNKDRSKDANTGPKSGVPNPARPAP
jgi:hypothetical protein